MKRNLLIAAACVLLLGACAQHAYGPRSRDRADTPQVSVVNGRIEVPELVVFLPQERDVKITWQLPKEGRARFADNGIVIEGQVTEQPAKGERECVAIDRKQTEVVECRREPDGLAFSCRNRHTKSGIYKYTIRVTEDGKLLERDPFIANM